MNNGLFAGSGLCRYLLSGGRGDDFMLFLFSHVNSSNYTHFVLCSYHHYTSFSFLHNAFLLFSFIRREFNTLH